ncbi:hypothetical protein ACFOZY_09250 [Chungangia koreensis]|uniref:DUF3823 domain-containing protein n=1 Tax=Chungangia koreensis TaxID=752657 RepID=A0ABV8X3U5_9LACT
MKKIIMITLIALCLTACTDKENTGENNIVFKIQTESGLSGEIKPNYIGGYNDHYVNIFAGVVNANTWRQGTEKVFYKFYSVKDDLAVEVYPGSIYEPHIPKLPDGHYAEVLFEEVNRHAEKPKELFSGKITSSEEGIVKIPKKSEAYFIYTIKVFDDNGEFQDVSYKPLFTTYEDYHFVFNVRKPIYDQDEKVTLNIENWGPNYISYNEDDWKLYKQKDEEWEEVEDFLVQDAIIDGPATFHSSWSQAILIDKDSELLGSGRNVSINLKHIQLEKGFYKIQGTMGSKKHVFTVEDAFEVK